MKKCTKCNINKEDACYAFKNKEKGKRSTVCMDCQKVYKIAHYQNNKQQHYDRNKKTQKEVREYYVDFKSKAKCLKCDESEDICLDFHHLDPTKKDMAVGRLIAFGSVKRMIKEMEKCVVLCANCHRKVHAGIIDL